MTAMGKDAAGGGSAGLSDIRQRVEALGRANLARTGLASIPGGGADRSPALALVFMNPTRRNLASQAGWAGPRFPFIGTSRIWSLLGDCQLLDKRTAARFAKPAGQWSAADARELEGQLRQASLYITNVVKETAVDSSPPEAAVFRRYQSLLHEEMELVRPRLIIAFGLAAHRSLTNSSIRLADILEQALKTGRAVAAGSCRGRAVIPCHFPIGRGNPRKAAVILRLVAAGKVAPN